MTYRQSATIGIGGAVVALWLAGCSTPPKSGYVPAEEQGVMTVELDDHDYDLVAEGLAKEMLERGLPQGYVVALGPVDTSECPYDVRVRTLQKSLQVIFNKEGTLKFMAAIDAMKGSAANPSDAKGPQDFGQIYKLIEYNWHNRNPVDQDALQKFGKLARVNGILFGRVSSLERKLSGGGKEITYRFVWELVNTETGIVDLSPEKKIRKNVK